MQRAVQCMSDHSCTPTQRLTLADHTAMELRVSVQNNSFRGLVARATTGSGGMLGKAGLVASCLAAVVGKYILLDKTS